MAAVAYYQALFNAYSTLDNGKYIHMPVYLSSLYICTIYYVVINTHDFMTYLARCLYFDASYSIALVKLTIIDFIRLHIRTTALMYTIIATVKN